MNMRFFQPHRQSEKGSALPLIGLAVMALCAATGLAVDAARLQLVQARLSYSLDAAGLAAGSTINTTNLTTEVAKYMNANFPAGYMGATAVSTAATPSADNMIITLTASTTVPMTFMKIFGIASSTLSVSSEVTRTATGLELVMALDNTGSMDGSKLSSLKSAVTTMVNSLYGSKTTVDNLWIGLVPFSQTVNIGTAHTAWMDTTYNNGLDWNWYTYNWYYGTTTHKGSWKGCVTARIDNSTQTYDITDDPPSVKLFKAYHQPDTNAEHNPYCPQIVTPMTADKTTILNAINNMAATGATHIDLGLAWAWRMISPRWRGLGWSSEMTSSNLPLDYGTKHMNKAIILLTDGENTAYTNVYTAYDYLSAGLLGTTNNTTVAAATLDSKMAQACSLIKAKGIYIYAITLGGDTTSNVKTLMKNCATSENYYFDSPSTSQLSTIFNRIADSLSSLRISK